MTKKKVTVDDEKQEVDKEVYEAVKAEVEAEYEKKVANVERGYKGNTTRLENERDALREEFAGFVDQVYTAWWNNDREGIQLAIRKAREALK